MMKKILIVDDEPAIVRLLSMRLTAHGYETVAANDNLQCIKSAQEEKPDLILLDMKMPAGGGIKAIESLKASVYTAMIPIIIITAYPGEEVKKQVMELGADDFFPKPFNSEDLIKKIEEQIA